MGIDARLKGESGEVLGEVHDPKILLSRAAQRDLFAQTRLLKYPVPWVTPSSTKRTPATSKPTSPNSGARIQTHRFSRSCHGSNPSLLDWFKRRTSISGS